MNSLALAVGVVKPILWLLPLLLLVAFLKSRAFKGWLGEKAVSTKASFKLPSGDYRAYDNVTIPDDASGTTQIDHIYVSRFGVFVVETKNLRGWIFGHEGHQQWTQTIYGKKCKFQNPIRQNFKHIKTLEGLIGLEVSKLHTVIVFTGEATFKTELPQCVCTLSNFTNYIKSFTTPVLTDVEVSQVCSRIESNRLAASRATRRAHVQYIRDKHNK